MRTTSKTTPHKSLILQILIVTISCIACAGSPQQVEVYQPEQATSKGSNTAWTEAERLDDVIDPAQFDDAAARAAIFYATNEQRQKHNLPLLTRSAALEASSQLHAERMKKHNFFDHIDQTGDSRFKRPDDRARQVGVTNPHVAENIAIENLLSTPSGQSVFRVEGEVGVYSKTAGGPPIRLLTYAEFGRRVVNGWMNSPGHRQNILHKDALELGGGAAFYYQDNFPSMYAVQNFQFFEPVTTSE